MKWIGYYAAAALLAVLVLLAPQPAWAWPWTKTPDPPAAKPAAKASTSDKTQRLDRSQRSATAQASDKTEKPVSKAEQARMLKKTTESASQMDRTAAKRTSPPSAKPAWSPVNSRYRWSAAQQTSPARRALTNTVNTLTLKPLRDKLSGNPTTHNPWSRSPPVTNTSANKRPGMLGSLFKPKPKKKTGPQTVGEWIQQDRPGF